MRCIDQLLYEEMIEEDTADILHMDNTDVDSFYPEEDEEFCNAILDDDDTSSFDKDFNLNYEED